MPLLPGGPGSPTLSRSAPATTTSGSGSQVGVIAKGSAGIGGQQSAAASCPGQVAAKATNGGVGKAVQYTCPPGTSPNPANKATCCPSGAKASQGLFQASGPGPAAPVAANIARPTLQPLTPEAAYDPEISRSLADQRSYTEDLRKGTGFAMDVLTGTQKDQLESEVIQARQAAANAGIPFDEAAFRATAQRGINASLAQEKLGREEMVGDALGAAAGTSGALAGERTDRLGLDLSRDVAENAQRLDLYGRDIQKYQADVSAATAANSALMDFYSRLMTGMFGMVGNVGSSMSMTNSSSYS